MNYFRTKSKVFANSIQFVTGKSYYKFTDENGNTIYSFQLKEYEIARVQNEIKSVHLTINSCDEKIKRIKEKGRL